MHKNVFAICSSWNLKEHSEDLSMHFYAYFALFSFNIGIIGRYFYNLLKIKIPLKFKINYAKY